MVRFLIVDDELSSVTGMSKLLTNDGHDVACFTEGADAVDALARAPFDAVITDLEMPEVDGHAVVRATREHHPHACLVVVTAWPERQGAKLIDAGACMIAAKPVEYDEVINVVGACRSHGPTHGRHCHMRARPEHHPVVTLRRK